jgi:membrane protein implicated in regulation of membrane protease activity
VVIVGLLVLLGAIGVGLSGVLANSGSEHLLGQDFNVLGLHLSGLTTGQLFLYGVIIGVVGMLGLSLLLGVFNKRVASRRSRRALKGSQKESQALRTDRDRLTQQLDDEHTEQARAESPNTAAAPDSPDTRD